MSIETEFIAVHLASVALTRHLNFLTLELLERPEKEVIRLRKQSEEDLFWDDWDYFHRKYIVEPYLDKPRKALSLSEEIKTKLKDKTRDRSSLRTEILNTRPNEVACWNWMLRTIGSPKGIWL